VRYHFPIFCVCEGTGEGSPCTHGENGGGAVGMGVMRVSDCGQNVGKADQVTPPEGWHPFRVKGPLVRRRREQVSPMSSPYVIAAATGEDQMALACPACAEHMKLEDIVKEAKDAAEKGLVQ
jgi:hypothetical protein